MTLKYKIEQETTIFPKFLIARIVSILTEQNYLIEDRTVDTVSFFKDDAWRIQSKTEILSKVDKGKVELKASITAFLTIGWE